MQKEIADRLHISLGTVKTHLARAQKRTGSHSGPQLQGGIHRREIEAIARKIKGLLDASDRHVARAQAWPPFHR